ncbi:excalibur calcium-binding domain-containing protein [Nocardia sp. CDC160]|uniref:excalibur calcium-binding domain-containing protein n=1 Tax=Nocardia sp. CDC160 TaxID=3112166 RepID=UPI002DB5FEE0|nr:excalibur calcium-binding domain-containing protein [Nocardia sp. CDC160]MEC3913115.1 excalibur calcium-binding domain-containing protein [Nocardia sp. CDC160]
MKTGNTFRARAAAVAALGVFGIVMPLGAVVPPGWSSTAVAQAEPGANLAPDPSGSNSLSRGDLSEPSAEPKAKPDPIYSSCEQVWDLGKGPIYEGQPGYSTFLDPDHNGVACER